MPNFAALRAAVFPLSTKNLRGGGGYSPPVGARVKLAIRRGRTYSGAALPHFSLHHVYCRTWTLATLYLSLKISFITKQGDIFGYMTKCQHIIMQKLSIGLGK